MKDSCQQRPIDRPSHMSRCRVLLRPLHVYCRGTEIQCKTVMHTLPRAQGSLRQEHALCYVRQIRVPALCRYPGLETVLKNRAMARNGLEICLPSIALEKNPRASLNGPLSICVYADIRIKIKIKVGPTRSGSTPKPGNCVDCTRDRGISEGPVTRQL